MGGEATAWGGTGAKRAAWAIACTCGMAILAMNIPGVPPVAASRAGRIVLLMPVLLTGKMPVPRHAITLGNSGQSGCLRRQDNV